MFCPKCGHESKNMFNDDELENLEKYICPDCGYEFYCPIQDGQK